MKENSLRQKLGSYSILAGAVVAMPGMAHGQFVFNDMPADVVLDDAKPFYALDLNGEDEIMLSCIFPLKM